MIRLTLLLLAGIAVVMVVAGRDPDGPEPRAIRASARTESAPAELVPQTNRLALDDEMGALERALAAGEAPPPATVPTTEAPVEAAGPAAETRSVRGERVNMRGGPGTTFDVVGTLQRGDAVEILETPGDGWVKLRAVRTGQTGWMADFLLAADG